MKNKDLDLAKKATERNRQLFVERLAYYNGDAIARKLRTEIGMPADGFKTVVAADAWLRPEGATDRDVARHHMEVACATRVMLERLNLPKNFYDAMRYFFAFNKIIHIPGSFSVTVTAGSQRIEHVEDMPLATGEKRLRDKLVNEIHKAMGHKSQRRRKNANKNAEELKLNHQKGVINGRDSETGEPVALLNSDRAIAVQMDADGKILSKTQEDAEVNRIKLARRRAKKRSC